MSIPFIGFAFNLVYADNQGESVKFYAEHFGFKIEKVLPDSSVWGHAGAVALWIGGGYRRREQEPDATHTSVFYQVPSVAALYKQLNNAGVRIVQEGPTSAGEGKYWFQFFDPAGNLLEVIGEE